MAIAITDRLRMGREQFRNLDSRVRRLRMHEADLEVDDYSPPLSDRQGRELRNLVAEAHLYGIHWTFAGLREGDDCQFYGDGPAEWAANGRDANRAGRLRAVSHRAQRACRVARLVRTPTEISRAVERCREAAEDREVDRLLPRMVRVEGVA